MACNVSKRFVSTNLEGKRILITGCNGHLGSKLVKYWHNQHELTLLDINCNSKTINKYISNSIYNHKYIGVDLSDKNVINNSDIKILFNNIDYIIHFAGCNPVPDQSWFDCIKSVDINNNLYMLLSDMNTTTKKRVIFASSNHALGGYLQQGCNVSKCLKNGMNLNDHYNEIIFNENTILNPGTKFELSSGFKLDSTTYAVGKLHGERGLISLSEKYKYIEPCILRIGWCQPGINHPNTLDPTGNSHDEYHAMHSEDENELKEKGFDSMTDLQIWFQNMWLSNLDFYNLMDACITFKYNRDKDVYILNGVSNNSDSRFNIVNDIGYKPLHNVHEFNQNMIDYQDNFERQYNIIFD
mmetsp:Transcript_62818/g.76867  ORF Transcript_62818/g.76867 Transcript_62818/m.76867 type:complete len:355 (+) Transcript_62818:50-1114(+)